MLGKRQKSFRRRIRDLIGPVPHGDALKSKEKISVVYVIASFVMINVFGYYTLKDIVQQKTIDYAKERGIDKAKIIKVTMAGVNTEEYDLEQERLEAIKNNLPGPD